MNARSGHQALPVGTVQITGKRQGRQGFQRETLLRFNIVSRRISGGTQGAAYPCQLFTNQNCTAPAARFFQQFPTTSKICAADRYHFLMLSVLYQGVSVPIWWLELGRLGQSSQWHRQLLIRSALRLLDLQGKVLLGDREYVGVDWFAALKRAGIDIVIRLRVSDYQAAIEASGKSIAKLEGKAKSQLGKVLWQSFTLNEDQYTFVLVAYRNRSGKEEFLRLITTLTPAQAVERYKQRYRIESMFKHLKSNGFNLEALHLEYGYKIRLMMAVVVLAYTLAVIYGLVDFKHKVRLKKHGSPEISVFRWGLDKWQGYLQQLSCFLEKLLHFAEVWFVADCKLKKLHVP